MGLDSFKYVVRILGHKPSRYDASKIHFDYFVVNGGGEWVEFPKVDSNCLNGQYPVILKG